LAQNINKYGLDWIKIAEDMNFSDPIKLKNRYYLHIKKKNKFEELLTEATKS